MAGYYTEKLAAERLELCYELASPRIRRYLQAEIDFVLERISADMPVLELGCGYGRILQQLQTKTLRIFGVDTSLASIRMARQILGPRGAAQVAVMDASALGFRTGAFNLTICIQNGICAFGVDRRKLFQEALRVTNSGGRVLFSSYSAGFWQPRLEWFEAQAAHGLIGPINHKATGQGVIVCTDGFKATTLTPESFADLADQFKLAPRITEVDGSSLFCEIIVP